MIETSVSDTPVQSIAVPPMELVTVIPCRFLLLRNDVEN